MNLALPPSPILGNNSTKLKRKGLDAFSSGRITITP